jgi:uncharacterized protein
MNLAQTAHRPYPLSTRPWAMQMVWKDLLFAHWPVPVAALRDLIPRGLELDSFDGHAWLGIVPFGMTGVAPRFAPPQFLKLAPGLSNFLELNVRTYVTHNGRAGVWFFSLDAANKFAVRAARNAFHLPYMDARMTQRETGGIISYSSVRTHVGEPGAEFLGRYKPVTDVYQSSPGTLEAWLTERYCLYSADRFGRLYRGEIHHQPWPLQRAELELEVNTMARGIGLELPDPPALLHFARELSVVAWLIDRV